MSKASSHFEILLAIKSQLKGLEDAEKGLGKLQKELGKIGETFAPGGIFKAAGLTFGAMTDEIKAAVAGSTKLAESLGDVRDHLQIRPEVFQVLSAGAKEAGGSVESLQKGIVNLRQRLEDALGGDKAARSLFESLKLNPEQLANQSTEAQLESIGRAIVSASDEARAFDAALDLLGGGAADNLPLLRRLGTDGFGALREEAERTRGIMGDGIVAALGSAEGRIEAAREKMTKGFAGLNLTILEAKASVVEFAAAHTSLLKSLMVGGATGATALKVMDGIKSFDWLKNLSDDFEYLKQGIGTVGAIKSLPDLIMGPRGEAESRFSQLGKALASPFAAAFAVTAGAAIITGLTDAFIQNSEQLKQALMKPVDEGIASVKAIRSMQSEADKDAFIKAEEKRILELEEKKKEILRKETRRLPEMEFGLGGERVVFKEYVTDEGNKQIAVIDQELKNAQTNVENTRSGKYDYFIHDAERKNNDAKIAAADQLATDWTEANAPRINAKIEAAEMQKLPPEEQLQLYRQQGEKLQKQHALSLSNAASEAQRQKLDLQFKDKAIDLNQTISDLEQQIAAKKEQQANAEKRRAEEAQRALEAQQRGQEEEQRKREEASHKALERDLDADARVLNEELQKINSERARIQSDFTKTEAEKETDLLSLLQREKDLYDQQVAALREKLALSTTPQERKTIQGSLDSLVPGQSQAGNALMVAQSGPDPNSVVDQMQLSLTKLENQFGTVAQNIAQTFTGVIKTGVDSVSQGLSGVIMGTMTWHQALLRVGQTIVSTVVQGISRMFTEWLTKRAMVAAKEIILGKQEAVAKAPSALLESIKSYGVAALLGGAAFAAIMAATGGFAEGGYTGAGGRNEVAGVVHRGEFVMPAHAVNRIGVDALESLAFDNVAPSYMGASAPSLSPVSPNVNVTSAPAQVQLVVLDDERRLAQKFKNSPELQNVLADLMRRQIREVVPT